MPSGFTASNWTSLGLSAAPTVTTEVSAYALSTAGVITATLSNIKPTTIDGQTVTWTPGFGSTATTWTVGTTVSSASELALVTKTIK